MSKAQVNTPTLRCFKCGEDLGSIMVEINGSPEGTPKIGCDNCGTDIAFVDVIDHLDALRDRWRDVFAWLEKAPRINGPE